MVEELLECRGLSAGYGGMAVVRDLDLRVGQGEIVALVGPNGAGKTTTLLTLAGDLPPLRGAILIDGQPSHDPLYMRARRGLSFVTEERSVFMGLSAADNLRLAGVPRGKAIELFPELEPLMRRTAGLLSGGEQQMLTLARALGRAPRLLLADELSLGLAPLVVQRLLHALREAADGCRVGVLLVEQHVSQALKVADRVYIMQAGKIVLQGTGAEIGERIGDLERLYLAGDAKDAAAHSPVASRG